MGGGGQKCWLYGAIKLLMVVPIPNNPVGHTTSLYRDGSQISNCLYKCDTILLITPPQFEATILFINDPQIIILCFNDLATDILPEDLMI